MTNAQLSLNLNIQPQKKDTKMMSNVLQPLGHARYLIDIYRASNQYLFGERIAYFDTLQAEDLFGLRHLLERETADGVISLITQALTPGCITILCAADLDVELSYGSKFFSNGHDEFKVLSSIYVNDRRKAFELVRNRAASLASETLTGSEKHHWFEITEENAIAALKAAA